MEDNHNFRYVIDALNAKHERTERRLFIVIVSLIASIVVLTAAFLWYASMPIEEVVVDNGSGNASYVGNDMIGDFNYGKDIGEEEGPSKEGNQEP